MKPWRRPQGSSTGRWPQPLEREQLFHPGQRHHFRPLPPAHLRVDSLTRNNPLAGDQKERYHAVKNPDPRLRDLYEQANLRRQQEKEHAGEVQSAEKTTKKHDKMEVPKPPSEATTRKTSQNTTASPPQAAARKQGAPQDNMAFRSAVSLTDIYFLGMQTCRQSCDLCSARVRFYCFCARVC